MPSNEIILELDKEAYSPGDEITGTLTLEVEKPISLYTLCVFIFGKEKTLFSMGSGDNKKFFKDNKEIFSETIYLIGEDTGKKPDKTTIPVGSYEYEFSFELPTDIKLPPCIDIAKSNITYGAWGHIEDKSTWAANKKKTSKRKKSNQVKETFLPFQIVGDFLPEEIRSKKVYLTMQKKYTLGKKAIEIDIRMDKDHWAQGEELELNLNINNQSSKKISKLETYMQPHFTQRTLKKKELISKMPQLYKTRHSDSSVSSGEEREFCLPIELESTIFPTLTSATLMSYYHVLVLRVHVKGESFFEIAMPITIVCSFLKEQTYPEESEPEEMINLNEKETDMMPCCSIM